jgi:RNA polymerase sigma-54 factor
MKNSLQLKLSQHLALTPQLQQSIRLLQLSTLELNQELERFLQENPLLERSEQWEEGGEGDSPLPIKPTLGQDATPSSTEHGDEPAARDWDNETSELTELDAHRWRDDDDTSEFNTQIASRPSLLDHLIGQLRLSHLSDRDFSLCSLLLAHLNEDGYLTTALEDITPDPEEIEDFEPEELLTTLRLIQSLDPLGVGARSISECLTLQLSGLNPSPARDLALRIVGEHLELLAQRDISRLRKNLGCSEIELRDAKQLIASCNPKPAAAFTLDEARYVTPDVYVRKIRGRWRVSLNQDAIPKLRVHRLYADLLQKNRDSHHPLSAQLQEARWLIKNIQQRFDTILRVSQAIVDQQNGFFEHGEVAMRPLVLREIAEEVGLHESTVSRVTTQKFMLTPQGLFELKYFFSSHVGTEAGGAASSTAIRALIKQLVAAEDRRKPLSDSRISDILAEQGIVVARRTVAKYREAMQIHPASQRKSL